MEPIKKDKPGTGLFLLMTLVYFGSYFGLKYVVFDGDLPWYYNVALIAVCLGLVFALRDRFTQKEG